ncbi:MAG: DMT family transporter [Bacteroidota bacterium]
MPTLSRPAVLALTAFVMVAFAANSVLARLALATTETGAATFTAVRLLAGALVLVGIVTLRTRSDTVTPSRGGNWASAVALFVYAAAFSFAYLSLATGTGALLLFGAVQLTMIGWGLVHGERFGPVRTLGLVLAMGGLVVLVAPGVEAPPLGAAVVMALSGAAWGAYSLRGRGAVDPVAVSAGNFWRAAILGGGLVVAVVAWPGPELRADAPGLGYGVLSGALTSGLGYVLWYRVLPHLRAASAATVQLSVPVLAALGGVAFVGEAVTLRLAVATVATLGGIALVVRGE